MQTIALSWVDPSTDEPAFGVYPLPLSIGRAPDNGLVLDSGLISAHHATLRMEPQGLVVEDAGSRNGVFVNGQRVRGALVNPGDVLGLGPFQIVVRLEARDVRVRLDWVDPASGQSKTAVHRLPMTVGRGTSNSVVIAEPNAADPQIVVQSEGEHVTITDMTGSPTIAVEGQWVPRAAVLNGAALQLGAHRFVLTLDSAARRRSAGEATIVLSDQQVSDVQQRLEQSSTMPWPPPLFSDPVVPVAALAQFGLPVYAVDYATVGAGIGGFIWVDNLLIRGVRHEQIAALGVDPVPYSRYRRLCRNSQIPDHERLRSNSEATPDNVWGWPGYAAREIAGGLAKGHVGEAAKIFWEIFGEPSLSQTYTPRAIDVFNGMDREAKRIGWERVMRYGRVRAIRKTDDGRYAIAYSAAPSGPPQRAFLVTRYLHLATGYPALQFLPDLQKYREETEDFVSVVNAYEDHDHVYRQLEQQGGLVLLRGRGIVASRIIQRVSEARRVNPRIALVHLMRTPLLKGHEWKRARRDVDNHFELQPFNWPKACWGGDLRELLEKTPADQRKQLFNDWGGTTTAKREDWLQIVNSGVREGWYQIVFGEVEKVERTEGGRIVTSIRGKGHAGGHMRYDADFIIDATGLEASAQSNPLVKDLIDHYALPLNGAKRLAVENDFELLAMRNGPGRMYGAGALTAGGPFAPVDSFLGLQYIATVSLDSLHALGAPGLRGFGPLRSVSQWMRWAAGASP